MSTAQFCTAIAIFSVLLAGCDSTSLDVAGSETETGTAATETDNANTNEAGNSVDSTPVEQDDFFWVQQAQDFPAFVPPPGIGAAHEAGENINLGRWGEVIEWPQIATGAAHLPDGRLLTWSSSQENDFGGATTFTHGSIFDPLTESFTNMPNENQNMFCAGVSMLADGSVLTPGGGATITTTSIFDGNSWSLSNPLNAARWYNQSTTLPSGQVLTSLGKSNTSFSELWTQGEGWKTLSNANLQSVLDDTSAPNNQRRWFPALNVAPDGSLFHAGPTSELFSLDLYTNGNSISSHGQREDVDQHRLYNTTVMYDIGKMLIAGGGKPALNTAMTIDLNGNSPVVTEAQPMTFARSMQDSIVLPNGKVLVIGGNSSGIQFSDEGTQLFPEMWDPQTGQWETLAPHSKPRNYHSTAMLLKDGRVAAMGSGLCGNCATNQQNGEIFEPPYLFNADGTRATQPEITAGPDEAVAGDALAITATGDLQSFSMLRLVALTHHHTTDQRFVPLGFTETASGAYSVQLPSNANVLVPGYYWVFGLNANGVPSAGHTVMINPTTERVPEPPTFISFEYYEGEWDLLPDFDSLTPVTTGETSVFSTGEAQREDFYGLRFTATLNLPTSGAYTFFTSSDDGSQLFINGEMVVDNDGLHSNREEQGAIDLAAGTHEIVVTYFEKSGGNSLAVQMQGPGIVKQSVEQFLQELDDTIAPVTPIATDSSIDPVISYEYFEGAWRSLPDFDTLTPVASGELQEFTTSPRAQSQFYGFRYTTTLYAPTAEQYTFYTVSDDGSALYVNGQLVVDNDGLHSSRERQGSINLAQGEHDIVVEVFQRTGGERFEVSYETASIARQPLLPSVAPVIATTSPDHPDNLIANGGFNTGLSDWSVCGGQANVTGGNASLASGGCIFQEFPVLPQATYTLTCDASVAAGFASIQVSVSDTGFSTVSSDLTSVTSAGKLPYMASVVAPADGAQGAVTLYAEDTASFDNCVILADESTVVPVNIEPAENELLVNPGFSNNLDGWFSCGGEQVLSTDGLNGGQSVKLRNEGCLFQEFSVTPGTEYSIACVGRSIADFSSVTYTEFDGSFAELDTQLQVVSNGPYQTSEFAITASDSAQSAAITLYADTDAFFDSCGVVVTGGAVAPEITVTPLDPASNLLTNGDFTNDGNDWLSCGGTTDIDTVGTGNSNAVTLGVESCVFQEFEATPGSEYAVSCAASAIDFASLSISYSDAAFTQLASGEASVPGGTLSTVQVAEIAPADTARGAVTLYADQSAVFDDCVVVEL